MVAMQIRRHCAGIDFPSAAPTKHFQQHGDDQHSALPVMLKSKRSGKPHATLATSELVKEQPHRSSLAAVEDQLWATHAKYLELFEEHSNSPTLAVIDALTRGRLVGHQSRATARSTAMASSRQVSPT